MVIVCFILLFANTYKVCPTTKSVWTGCKLLGKLCKAIFASLNNSSTLLLSLFSTNNLKSFGESHWIGGRANPSRCFGTWEQQDWSVSVRLILTLSRWLTILQPILEQAWGGGRKDCLESNYAWTQQDSHLGVSSSSFCSSNKLTPFTQFAVQWVWKQRNEIHCWSNAIPQLQGAQVDVRLFRGSFYRLNTNFCMHSLSGNSIGDESCELLAGVLTREGSLLEELEWVFFSHKNLN